jgi:hypothetical protein
MPSARQLDTYHLIFFAKFIAVACTLGDSSGNLLGLMRG